MSQSQLFPVQFHGDTIFCTTIDGQPFAPVKPIVENMGVSWQGQQAKLNTNSERWGIKMILIPSESGEQRTLCMPVRKLPAFLASINPKKVKAELRPKIELYQAECDNVLWDYWTKGRAERPASVPAIAGNADQVKPGIRIHKVLFLQRHQIRVVTENGKLWLPVSDIGNALGYAAPANWVLIGLPKTWDGKLAFDRFNGAPSIVSPLLGKSHAPDCRVLSEEAVRVVLERSTKPDAITFKHWLYSVVIPELRKGGWYGGDVEPIVIEPANAPGQTLPALVMPSGLQGYMQQMRKLEEQAKELLGEIVIEVKPILLDAAWTLANRQEQKHIAPLAISFLAPFEEARSAMDKGFTLARRMLDSAEFLSSSTGDKTGGK